jgi:hypothetical protein
LDLSIAERRDFGEFRHQKALKAGKTAGKPTENQQN